MSLAILCRACGASVLTIVAGSVMLDRSTAAAPPASPVVASGSSPFARCSEGAAVRLSDGDSGYQTGGDTNYAGTAVEPAIAANPRTVGTGHVNLIGVWQQDRWSSAGARGVVASHSFDGGRTWGDMSLPFSTCASRQSPFVRASDPWVSIGADGRAYASALGLGASLNGVIVATSTDGGASWGRARSVIRDRTDHYQNDKPSVTADPARPGVAYITWNRTLQPVASHHLHSWFAETTDGGRTWSTPRPITPSLDSVNAFGHQIVVDAKQHILYNVFMETIGSGDPAEAPGKRRTAGENATASRIAFVTSVDGGRSWSRPRTIARVPPLNPLADFFYRVAYPVPAVALDPVSGKLYVVWADARVDEGNRPEIVLATSADRGAHWGTPLPLSGPGERPAFTPAIGVSRQGVVGVAFYSANHLYASNTDSDPHPPRVMVNASFASSHDGGRHFGAPVHLGGPFNYWAAPFANGYFLGDYQGLAVSGEDFHPFFVMTRSKNSRNGTDVFTTDVRPT